jgi:hypothetical protein
MVAVTMPKNFANSGPILILVTCGGFTSKGNPAPSAKMMGRKL